MNAIIALCKAGGTIRITVFRNYYSSENVEYYATVLVSCTVNDNQELIPVNLFTVKGVLKKIRGEKELILYFGNSKDLLYPNFWFGSGFSNYVNADTVIEMLSRIPLGTDDKQFVEFRILENGTIQKVDSAESFYKKSKSIAEEICSIISKSHGKTVRESDSVINAIIDNDANYSIFIQN
jgi:hypothetical protein